MNKLLAGLLALAIASPAFAWGDRELRYRDWETDRKSTRLNSSH